MICSRAMISDAALSNIAPSEITAGAKLYYCWQTGFWVTLVWETAVGTCLGRPSLYVKVMVLQYRARLCTDGKTMVLLHEKQRLCIDGCRRVVRLVQDSYLCQVDVI